MCVTDKILCVAAVIARVTAKSGIREGKNLGKIPQYCLSKSSFEKFSKFFGIFNGENTLFTKSAQKMV